MSKNFVFYTGIIVVAVLLMFCLKFLSVCTLIWMFWKLNTMPDVAGEDEIIYGQAPDYLPFNRDKDFPSDKF